MPSTDQNDVAFAKYGNLFPHNYPDVIKFYGECENLRQTARKFVITHQSVMHNLAQSSAYEIDQKEMAELKRKTESNQMTS